MRTTIFCSMNTSSALDIFVQFELSCNKFDPQPKFLKGLLVWWVCPRPFLPLPLAVPLPLPLALALLWLALIPVRSCSDQIHYNHTHTPSSQSVCFCCACACCPCWAMSNRQSWKVLWCHPRTTREMALKCLSMVKRKAFSWSLGATKRHSACITGAPNTSWCFNLMSWRSQ